MTAMIKNKKLLKSVALGMSLFAGLGSVNVANAGGLFDGVLDEVKAEVNKTAKDIFAGSIRRARETSQYESEARAGQRKAQTDMQIAAENRAYGEQQGFICQTDIRTNTYGGSGQNASTTNASSGQCSDTVYAQERTYDIQYEGQAKRRIMDAAVQIKINEMYRQNANDMSYSGGSASSYQYSGDGVSYYGRQSNYERYHQQQQQTHVKPTYKAPSGPVGASRY